MSRVQIQNFSFLLKCPKSGFEKKFVMRGSSYAEGYIRVAAEQKALKIHREECPIKECSAEIVVLPPPRVQIVFVPRQKFMQLKEQALRDKLNGRNRLIS